MIEFDELKIFDLSVLDPSADDSIDAEIEDRCSTDISVWLIDPTAVMNGQIFCIRGAQISHRAFPVAL